MFLCCELYRELDFAYWMTQPILLCKSPLMQLWSAFPRKPNSLGEYQHAKHATLWGSGMGLSLLFLPIGSFHMVLTNSVELNCFSLCDRPPFQTLQYLNKASCSIDVGAGKSSVLHYWDCWVCLSPWSLLNPSEHFSLKATCCCPEKARFVGLFLNTVWLEVIHPFTLLPLLRALMVTFSKASVALEN